MICPHLHLASIIMYMDIYIIRAPTCLLVQGVRYLAECSAHLFTRPPYMDNYTFRVTVGLDWDLHSESHILATIMEWRLTILPRLASVAAGVKGNHAAINDIIHRALSSAHVPSYLEPSGIYCSNSKHLESGWYHCGAMEEE